MPRARECLEQAIAIDPGYALPHSVMGGSFVTPAVFGMLPAHQAMPPARAAYQKALEIDPALPEALVGLASISMLYDYNWKEAGRLFEMAMARGPLPASARARYCHYLFFTGRPEAAMKEIAGAVQADPLNLTFRSMLAWALMITGRDVEAASECRHILELDEKNNLGHFYLSLISVQRGEIREALASAEKAYSAAPWVRAGCGYVAALLKLTGDTDCAGTMLEKLGDGQEYGAPFGFVYYYLVGSEVDQAADWAEKAIEQRDAAVRNLLVLPLAKDLRQSARWPALAKMLNLP